MSNITVTVTGLKELAEAARKLPLVASKEISRATEKSMNAIWNRALKEAPVNKKTGGGNLRQNIRGRMVSRFKGVIQSFATYSLYVLEGTKPHVINVVKAKVLANKRTNQFFGKTVNHPGTQPNPFFERAVEASQEKIQGYVDKALQNILNTLK